MKHGQKAKARTAKALEKDRSAKAGAKSAAKKSDKTKSVRTPAKTPIAKKGAGKEDSRSRLSGRKAVAAAAPERKTRVKADDVAFSSPAVASAFRRAVKKYSTALKRLTD